MAKVLIGTYTVGSDEVRIDCAECPKYDRAVTVKAGAYPVYAYEMDITPWGGADTCYLDFGEFSECWHGFIMAKQSAFTPGDGWTIRAEKYISDIDGAEHELWSIIREE